MAHPMLAATAILADLLPSGLRLGDPDIVGALAAYPVLGEPGTVAYSLLADALSEGAALREVEPADVNRLRLDAPARRRVLLFAGEEVIGAKQNRIVNATVVIEAGESVEIPVSCIEHGRWSLGGERHGFRASTQVAYTSLRGAVSGMVSGSRSRGRSYDTDQGRVWSEVAERTTLCGVRSQTGAMTAIFEAQRPSVERVSEGVSVRDGQVGLLAFIGGRFAALDLVSSPDAWRSLHPRIVRGHALEALRVAPGRSASSEDASGVLSRLSLLRAACRPVAVGVGTEVRAEGSGLHAAGVLVEGELLQLSAFAQAG